MTGCASLSGSLHALLDMRARPRAASCAPATALSTRPPSFLRREPGHLADRALTDETEAEGGDERHGIV